MPLRSLSPSESLWVAAQEYYDLQSDLTTEMAAEFVRWIFFSVLTLQMVKPSLSFLHTTTYASLMSSRNLGNNAISSFSVGLSKKGFARQEILGTNAQAKSGVESSPRNPIRAVTSLFSSRLKSNVFHKLLLLLRDVYGQFLVLFMDTFINRYNIGYSLTEVTLK